MSFEERRRKITTYTTSSSRSGFGASSNRSAFGYWIPLALTVTAATVGLVAWVWSERNDDEETDISDSEEHYYGTTGPVPAPGPGQGPGGPNFGPGAAMAGGAAAGAAAGYAMSGSLPPGPGPAGFQGGPPGPGMGQPPVAGGFQGGPPPGPTGFQDNRGMSTGIDDRSNINVNVQQDNSFYSRMTNALGFGYNNPATYNEQGFQPQPQNQNPEQQTWIGKGMATAAAGAAAAGAVVGSAVKSLRESGEEQFSDQEKWSEEADKPERSSPKKGIRRTGTAEEFYSGAVDIPRRSSVGTKFGKRRTVAVVVSSVSASGADDTDLGGHASILAHLPEHINHDTTRIFVLIYAPDLRVHPLSAAAAANQPAPGSTSIRPQPPQQRSSSSRRQSTSGQSTTSSFANIPTPGADGQTPAQTPGDFPMDPATSDLGILTSVSPRPVDSSAIATRAVDAETSALYKTLHNQALTLVDKDTMILPFTSANGHKHILRSIQPEIVYIQESLCGREGDLVADLQGWVRQVVVVIGDEGGLGGLVDTDTENEDEKNRGRTGNTAGKWWSKEEVSGLGRGVGIVESLRVGDDWRRRVGDED